jgi:hypothetical protein
VVVSKVSPDAEPAKAASPTKKPEAAGPKEKAEVLEQEAIKDKEPTADANEDGFTVVVAREHKQKKP